MTRGALVLLAALAFDAAAGGLLWRARAESADALAPESWALPRAARLDAPPRPAAGRSDSAEDDGVLNLARLVLPGYDPAEIRADAAPLDTADFPEEVRALHGQRLTTRGYVLPVELERGRITRFLLSRFPPGCCFGKRPVLDEWIEVEHPEGIPSERFNGRLALVTGVLDVGEVVGPAGFSLSLYRMESAEVRPAGRD